VAQVVEHLLYSCEALSSNPRQTKKKKIKMHAKNNIVSFVSYLSPLYFNFMDRFTNHLSAIFYLYILVLWTNLPIFSFASFF
jgi:hypothetical protein